MSADGPILLLLPGLDGTAKLFQSFTAQLSSQQAWIAVAYPTEVERDFDSLADVAQAALPPDGLVVVVAESFSGAVALRLLKRRLPNIVGAIFIASFARPPNGFLGLTQILPISLLAALGKNKTVLRTFCLGQDAPLATIDSVRNVLNSLPLPVLKARLDLLRYLDETLLLKQISIPVLCLRAEHDRLVMRDRGMDCHDVTAGCATQTIDGPHFLLQTRPVECWRVISRWLTATTRAA